jgi:hypothetical protein
MLRSAPNAKAAVLHELEREQAVEAVAAHGDWFRVRHRGVQGYIAAKGLQTSDDPLRQVALPQGTALRDAPGAEATEMLVLDRDTSAALLATDGGHQLVRVQDVLGWVEVLE